MVNPDYYGVTADTVRRARKRLANHGRRRDGTYYGRYDSGWGINVDDVLHMGERFDGMSCLVGALALEHGDFYQAVLAATTAFDLHGHGTPNQTVTTWNDTVDDDTVDQFLDRWEAKLP